MPVNDLRRFTPDVALVGENVARTLRILAKLLLDWSDAEAIRVADRRAKRRQSEGTSDEPTPVERQGLPAIYFDKLAMSFGRVWDSLHVGGHVRYRVGLLTHRGFYGPGKALRINRSEEERQWLQAYSEGDFPSDYAFSTEVVSKLKPSLGNARVLFRVEGDDARSSGAKVFPELDGTLWDLWTGELAVENGRPTFLTREELYFVHLISSGLALLEKDQLRALGTHSSSLETRRDIEFNRRAWDRNADSVLSALRGKAADAGVAAYRMVTTVREIQNKSDKNRGAYTTARDALLGAFHMNRVLRETLEQCNKSASEIWESDIIRRYRAGAEALLHVSVYCRRAVTEVGLGTKLSPREMAESDAAANWLRTTGNGLCGEVEGFGSLQAQGKAGLASCIERLRRSIWRLMPLTEDAELSGVP